MVKSNSISRKNPDSPWGLAGGAILGVIGFIAALVSGVELASAIGAGLVGLMLGGMGGEYLKKRFSDDTPAPSPVMPPVPVTSIEPARDPVALQNALEKGYTPAPPSASAPMAPATPMENRVNLAGKC